MRKHLLRQASDPTEHLQIECQNLAYLHCETVLYRRVFHCEVFIDKACGGTFGAGRNLL